MTTRHALSLAIDPALTLLPAKMESTQARALLIAIGWQESKFAARRQQPAGPARGFWQFEKAGGVVEVLTRRQTRVPMAQVCEALSIEPTVEAVYAALPYQDILAAACARLLLWALPEPLPGHLDVDVAWHQYLKAWRPGKPRPVDWPESYAVGWGCVFGDRNDAVGR